MSEHAPDHDTHLDPAAQAALDALLREPQLTGDEWSRLHAGIMRAAEPALAARRHPTPALRHSVRRWRWRWLAPALPLAAAAALLLVLRGGPDAPPLGEAEAALLADVSEQEFRTLVSGHADAASLLLLAVEEEP